MLIFLMLTFLAATQDIIVDGWAISLLSKENVAWQSICNGVGQKAGLFVGNIFFIILESATFCNKYLRPMFKLPSQNHGIVDLECKLKHFSSPDIYISIILVFCLYISAYVLFWYDFFDNCNRGSHFQE